MASIDDVLNNVHELSEVMKQLLNQQGVGMGAGGNVRADRDTWSSILKEVEKLNKEDRKSGTSTVKGFQKAQEDFLKKTQNNQKETWEAFQETSKNLDDSLTNTLHKTSETQSKTAVQITDAVAKSNSLSSTIFSHAVDSFNSYSELNKHFTEQLRTNIKKQQQKGGTFDFDPTQLESFGDVRALKERLEGEKELLAGVNVLRQRVKEARDRGDNLADATTEQKGKIKEWGESLGLSQERIKKFEAALSLAAVGNTKNLKQLQEEIIGLDEAVAETAQNLTQVSQSSANTGRQLKALAYWGSRAAQEIAEFAQTAAKQGAEFDAMFGSFLMGMSGEERAQLQNQSRQTALAMQSSRGAISNFENQMSESQWEMAAFTGGLKESSEMGANLIETFKTLGQSSNNTASFIDTQQERFKNWNRVFGVTVDQFTAMNEQLMQSQNVRTQMYKLDQDRRKAYFDDLQLTYQRLRSQGLLHEQALETVEAMSEIGGQDAKTRLEEAARLQAVMGAQGMGQMGAEAARLIRGGLRGEGEQQQFADIMGQASKQVSDQMANSFTSELVTGQMISEAGLEKYLGPQSKFADVEIQQEKAIVQNVSATQNLTSELRGLRKQLALGPEGLMGGAAASKQMFGQLFSGITGVAANTALTAFALGPGKRMIGRLLGFGGAGGAAGGGLLQGLKGMFSSGSQKAAAQGAAATTQTAARGVATRGASMIPGLGAIAGGLNAARHLGNENYGAAALSGAGAIANFIPGFGGIANMGAQIGSEFLTGNKNQQGQMAREPLSTDDRQVHRITGLLERNNELLQTIADNVQTTTDVNRQIADNTGKSAKQVENQNERNRQRQDEMNARERSRRAHEKLNQTPTNQFGSTSD